MIINIFKRWIVITPPKTGSCSLNSVLITCFDGWLYHDIWHHNTEIPEKYKDFAIYLSVRNPYARYASLWRHHIRDFHNKKTYQDFLEFMSAIVSGELDDIYYKNTLCDWAEDKPLTGFIRLENIAEDIKCLGPNYPYVVPLVNQAPCLRPWWVWYDKPEVADLVREYCEKDFERFGYDKEFIDNLNFLR